MLKMLKMLETLKDSAESALDSALVHMENCHRRVDGYVRTHLPRRVGARQALMPRQSIYDLLRGLNWEVGALGTDLFQIIEDARARRRAERGSS